MTAVIADTSVFIALEGGRTIDLARLPDELVVTVVTVAELEAGVLAASDTATRALRLRTLHEASKLAPLAIDGSVAGAWAHLRAAVLETGRRMGGNDLWIAAVAVARGLPVVTQDDDFDVLAELGLLEVVKV